MAIVKTTKYVNKQAVCEVLGSFMQKPSLIKEFKTSKNDFTETFHKIIFAALNNLYLSGVENIDAVAIDEYLSHYDTQYKTFTKNNGIDFLEQIAETAIPVNIKYYFDQLKKFSLLRRYVEHGVDVSEFFDPDEINSITLDAQRVRLDKCSINDIIDHFKKQQIEIASPFIVNENRDSKKAGVGGIEQLEKWKKNTSWGIGYSSAYYTTAVHGLRKKKFSVKSASTGAGKTRTSMADIAFSCSPKYFNKKLNKWCENPNGLHNSVLYIGTEMELLEEIDPILWAYIADVPQEHIEFNCYEDGEEERVREAIRILTEEANIWLEYVPNYNSSALEEIIEYHKITHKITHVFFDYIHTTVELLGEFSEQGKTKMIVREDQVLANLSNKLKNMARRFDVSIDSYTQVTGDFKNEENRDQTIVRGAKSIIDKCDIASIMMPPTAKELKKIEPILEKMFCKNKPNIVISLYKNRGGKWNKIKIWLYIDYDTMRTHDLFVTDYEYKIIVDMPKTYINITNGVNSAANIPTTKSLDSSNIVKEIDIKDD